MLKIRNLQRIKSTIFKIEELNKLYEMIKILKEQHLSGQIVHRQYAV
jgi:hypothetical protein